MGRSGFSIKGLPELIKELEAMAYQDLIQEIHKALEQLGEWLLALAQVKTPIDTGRLYQSFQRGHPDSIWRVDLNREVVQLQLGTDVEYSGWVEEGHWANPQGVAVRWVPGYWVGDRFIYDPTSSTGMALKQQWVTGYHMFEISFEEIERLAPDYLGRTIQEVFDRAAQRIGTRNR